MQNLNLNISAFIDKINDYAILIISFLKTTFNNIIAIKDCSFGNLLNSTGIIINFIFALFYILIFITLLVFLGSIFNIIKILIKWIFKPFKLIFKGIVWFVKLFIKQPTPNNKIDELQKKLADLEYKNNLMIKYIKENKYQKRG